MVARPLPALLNLHLPLFWPLNPISFCLNFTRAAPVVFAPHVETSAGIMLPDAYISQLAAAAHASGVLNSFDSILFSPVFLSLCIMLLPLLFLFAPHLLLLPLLFLFSPHLLLLPLLFLFAPHLLLLPLLFLFAPHPPAGALLVLDCIASGCMWVDMKVFPAQFCGSVNGTSV